jgi:hypothetical protein
MAEHVAHVHLNARGVGAAHSRMFRFDGRMFLEVDRFDRVGAEGRRGVISLQSAMLARGGAEDSWSRAALRLTIAGILPKNDARQVRLVESFARQIANTDLHPGNLSLFDRHDGSLALAPVYDMLPSLFAPQGGELVERVFESPQPTAETLDVWPQARRLAEGYWERLAAEQQLSPGFRQLCARALGVLRATPQPSAPTG